MMTEPEREPDNAVVEIAPLPVDHLRRIARRWVGAVLVVQSGILAIRLTADWYSFYVGPQGHSLWLGLIWIAHFCLWTAAGVLWPMSVVIAPMIVTFSCIAVQEDAPRMAIVIGASVLLTGVPYIVLRMAFAA